MAESSRYSRNSTCNLLSLGQPQNVNLRRNVAFRGLGVHCELARALA